MSYLNGGMRFSMSSENGLSGERFLTLNTYKRGICSHIEYYVGENTSDIKQKCVISWLVER